MKNCTLSSGPCNVGDLFAGRSKVGSTLHNFRLLLARGYTLSSVWHSNSASSYKPLAVQNSSGPSTDSIITQKAAIAIDHAPR